MFWGRLLTPEEKGYFNRFVMTAEKGHILQSWEWGDLKGKGEWQPYRLLVETEEDGERKPVAAISILARRIPVLGKQIFMRRGVRWGMFIMLNC